MLKKIHTLLNKLNGLFSLLASTLTFFLLVSSSLAGGIYGKLDRDRNLDNMFRNYEVMQDYNYFTTGDMIDQMLFC